MNWLLIALIAYTAVVIFVCFRVLYDINSTTKAFAYLLVLVFLPVIGMVIYFAVGANYRKEKLYSKKIVKDDKLLEDVHVKIFHQSQHAWDVGEPEVKSHKKLAKMLLNDDSPLTNGNEVKLLLNGENKFPEVLEALKKAKHHIHIEYYIFEDDNIGNQIKEILIKKAAEGVKVRFIYDDFGSRSIRAKFADEMNAAGVEAYPFYSIFFVAFSNRTNYRNHRKIIVVDGCVGFVGGINVSDKYINNTGAKQVFWRDTHVMLKGPGVYYLQYLFICDWNFCSGTPLPLEKDFFCSKKSKNGNAVVQIAASGPDSDTPTIMFSLIEAISMAEEEILITSPYFIPGDSILNSISIAALSGVKIKLLVPDKSDSAVINAAARSFYAEILEAGVEIYMYKKGFVHAKTLVADGKLAIVGSANMDHRSFELNFEVNCMIYDNDIARELRDAFFYDIKDAVKIDPKQWAKRSLFKQLPEKFFRLLSPLL